MAYDQLLFGLPNGLQWLQASGCRVVTLGLAKKKTAEFVKKADESNVREVLMFENKGILRR